MGLSIENGMTPLQIPLPPIAQSPLHNGVNPPHRHCLPPNPSPTSEAGPAPLDLGPRDIEAHVGAASSQLSFMARAAPGGTRLPPLPVLLEGGERGHQC